MMRKCAAALLLGLAMLATGCSRGDGGSKDATAQDAPYLDWNQRDDWPIYGRTFGEQHYSPLADIDDRNVGRLNLAWSMDLGVGNPVTMPIEVGGTLYFASGLSIVHAVDAATGKLLWRYDPRVADHIGRELRATWGGVRGVAWWNGKIYTATADGRLIAIDAKTGRPVWSVQSTIKGDGRFITGAPRVFRGKVIIGQGGGDVTPLRGYATAYDTETGKQLWRFFIVPGDPKKGFENKAMEMAAKTWSGEWWRFGGGGEPWNSYTYDPETNTILIGTGNGFPWNHKVRSAGKGDNLFLCSMVAVDADTGAYKWHYQYNPGESSDYNAAMDMELADLTIDGKPRKVVMSAPKNGFLYVIDRTNGQLISAEKIAHVNWAKRIDLKTGRPVENPAARFPNGTEFQMYPSANGAHSWMPMAYSPKTRLLYIPKIEHGMTVSDRGVDLKNWKPGPMMGVAVNFGPAKTPTPYENTSALLAWDPATQKQRWKIDTRGGWNSGILATAGNLVFQGQLDGRFSAYAGDSGKELWHFMTQNAMLAAPITYRAGGKQYVTVIVGMGTSVDVFTKSFGGISFDNRTQKKRVLTFVLDGTAKLPPAPPPFVVKPIADPTYKPDPALAAEGMPLYMVNCTLCHGWEAIAGGGAPDLRASAVPQSADQFAAIVRGGALVENSMPRFEEFADADLAAIRQYLRSRAADLRAGK
jgi:quinohemoprotein ethanol dehydrogenase